MLILGGFLGVIVQLATLILLMFLMFQTFEGKRYKLPTAGDYPETHLKNMVRSSSQLSLLGNPQTLGNSAR